jgi:hypothetical protein
MASIYIGFNRGADLSPDKATEGASTGSTDVELRIDTSKSMTRQDVNLITEAILRYLNDGRTAVFTE